MLFTKSFTKICAPVALLLLCSGVVNAQGVYQASRATWLKKAEDSKPKLVETIKQPTGIVNLVKDNAAFQGWKATPAGDMKRLYTTSFKKQSGIVVDFGEHLTGYFSFTVKTIDKPSDSPVRLKFIFGEVPAELTTPFDPYPGTISRAWLQDEVVTVTQMPATITIPRRLASRYVKIELLGASPYSDFEISGMEIKATTSVNTVAPPLAATTPKALADIDKVGLNTLKECMQTVYEDGPKRDARLWIGDLYLESLANIYSYKNNELTKRCLYLLASLSADNGYLISNVFETPTPHAQTGNNLLDYCFLYNVALKEYAIATGDKQTALDLWPVAKKQLDIAKRYTGPDGMMDYVNAGKDWWVFFDWKDGLDKQACLQGLTIYALNQTYALAKFLGKESEVADIPATVKKMTEAAHRTLFDKRTGLFMSGTNRQISYGSQAWMILGGVATKAEAQAALKAVATVPNAVHPGAPYMYHYYIAALIEAGLQKEAKDAVTEYWGGMVKKGATTFWEVYDPKNELLSPYNFYPVNSYCHAWSCTPVYFIRKYPEIFQK